MSNTIIYPLRNTDSIQSHKLYYKELKIIEKHFIADGRDACEYRTFSHNLACYRKYLFRFYRRKDISDRLRDSRNYAIKDLSRILCRLLATEREMIQSYCKRGLRLLHNTVPENRM